MQTQTILEKQEELDRQEGNDLYRQIDKRSWPALLASVHDQGATTAPRFDGNALTFIVSSWRFDWEGVDMGGGAPFAYDHGAHVPIVATLIPRACGDGINVYASGPKSSLEKFAEVATMHEGAMPEAGLVR